MIFEQYVNLSAVLKIKWKEIIPILSLNYKNFRQLLSFSENFATDSKLR